MKKLFSNFNLLLLLTWLTAVIPTALNAQTEVWKSYILLDKDARCIAVDQSGNIWYGTSGSGAVKYDGTNHTRYVVNNSGLPSNTVNAITVDTDGSIWFGTGSGVSHLNG